MRYIEGTNDFQLKNTCVTLGKFDGIHRGHQLLIDRLGEQKGLSRVMFTFNFHPMNLFSGREQELIFTEAERREYLERRGDIDVLISYPFDRETASMSPRDFVESILVKKLDAKVIVVGVDFCFGKDRAGDVALLNELSGEYGFTVIACEKVCEGSEIIGSTLIRKEIEQGNLEKAALLLGRSYSVLGDISHGRQIGRKLSFPTANLVPDSGKLLPANGVYFSLMHVRKNGTEELHRCVSNVGINPTVSEGEDNPRKVLESFVLDGDVDLYGCEVLIELLRFRRSERKFDSLEQLKAQIQEDSEAARSFFGM